MIQKQYFLVCLLGRYEILSRFCNVLIDIVSLFARSHGLWISELLERYFSQYLSEESKATEIAATPHDVPPRILSTLHQASRLLASPEGQFHWNRTREKRAARFEDIRMTSCAAACEISTGQSPLASLLPSCNHDPTPQRSFSVTLRNVHTREAAAGMTARLRGYHPARARSCHARRPGRAHCTISRNAISPTRSRRDLFECVPAPSLSLRKRRFTT